MKRKAFDLQSMQVFYYKFKNTNYKLLCNNILKPGNTKESMFGSNSIKITLQLWYRIWMSAILQCTDSVLEKQDALRGQMLLQNCHFKFKFQWGLNTTGLGTKRNTQWLLLLCPETDFLATVDTLYTSVLMIIQEFTLCFSCDYFFF